MVPGLGRPPEQGKGLPTPVFWPGEFHGLYSPCGLKELDMIERLSLHFTSLHFSVYLGLLNFLSVMFYSLQNITYILLKFIPEYFILFNTIV